MKRIGLMDITFDRLELKFVPIEVNKSRAVGELLFAASSDNLEGGAKMFINDKEIKIDGRIGLVDIPLTELTDGKVTAKIKFNNIDFEYEEEVEIIKNKDTNTR